MDASTQQDPVLDVENLTVGYGEGSVLHGVDMQLGRGQVVCLLGRNGVGKTTLLETIMGHLTLTQGRIRYQGQDISTWPPYRRAREGLGYVPQGRRIFPYLTVRENLLMGFENGSPQDEREIDRVLENFPSLQDIEDRSGGNLSGGEQQQLAIARVLVGDPDVLLLDEPTAGIQPTIVQNIGGVIQRLKEETSIAILLVEQFIEFALDLGDYLYVMKEGRIAMKESTGEAEEDELKRHLTV